MAEACISLRSLRKVFFVPERESGIKSALSSLVNRRTKQIVSVNDLSFEVQPGEIVGFLGPNGAGKTTTIKMLSGLLYPTGGEARVLGYVPWQRRKELLRQITLVMGQRNQLQWDLPSVDTYEFLRAIYDIPRDQYRRAMAELVDMLDIGDVISQPARNLSLGERMKCEIAGALLHQPRILFLDEPSIGLDVTVQHRLRNFIAEYNRRHEAAVILTSHYVPDVEILCKRVIFINDGKLIYDGRLSHIANEVMPYKTIVLMMNNDRQYNLSSYGEVVENINGRLKLRVAKDRTAAVTARLLSELPVIDLSVVDPPIEDVIRHMFNEKERAKEAV